MVVVVVLVAVISELVGKNMKEKVEANINSRIIIICCFSFSLYYTTYGRVKDRKTTTRKGKKKMDAHREREREGEK